MQKGCMNIQSSLHSLTNSILPQFGGQILHFFLERCGGFMINKPPFTLAKHYIAFPGCRRKFTPPNFYNLALTPYFQKGKIPFKAFNYGFHWLFPPVGKNCIITCLAYSSVPGNNSITQVPGTMQFHTRTYCRFSHFPLPTSH